MLYRVSLASGKPFKQETDMALCFLEKRYSFSLRDAESGHKFPKLQKTTGCETEGETLLSVSK